MPEQCRKCSPECATKRSRTSPLRGSIGKLQYVLIDAYMDTMAEAGENKHTITAMGGRKVAEAGIVSEEGVRSYAAGRRRR